MRELLPLAAGGKLLPLAAGENSFHRLRAVPLPRGGRSGEGLRRTGGTSKFLREGAKGLRGDRKAPIGNRRQGRRP